MTTIMTRWSRSNNMVKGIMILADGFEETEAVATKDILDRTHDIVVDLVSLTERKEVHSSQNLVVFLEKALPSLETKDYDFIVLPGGKVGMENLKGNPLVRKLLLDFYQEGKLVSAICASPSILGELGILKGKKYTCFPGFQSKDGDYLNVPAVKDENVITGHSMAYSLDFGMAIVRYFLGEEGVLKVLPGTNG